MNLENHKAPNANPDMYLTAPAEEKSEIPQEEKEETPIVKEESAKPTENIYCRKRSKG